jgi:ribonucleoside-diphosphate reductase beta chain
LESKAFTTTLHQKTQTYGLNALSVAYNPTTTWASHKTAPITGLPLKQIFNNSYINFDTEPLWFGQGKNIVRTDLNADSQLVRFREEIIGLSWRHTDFNYDADKVDFTKMDKPLQNLFLKNFKSQTLGDSIISRVASMLFTPLTNNPELELWFNTFQYNESVIHALNYSAVLKIVLPSATKELDDIMVNADILNRLLYLTNEFEALLNYNLVYLKTGVVTKEHITQLIIALHAQYILEGIMFQNSFPVTFLFDKAGLMRNNSKSIQKINIDEAIHINVDMYLIKLTNKQFEAEYKDPLTQERIYALFHKAYEIEQHWISYLLQEGNILTGLTKNSMMAYTKYNIHRKMLAIRLNPIVDKAINPFEWLNDYIKTDNLQIAVQETESHTYKIAEIVNDLTEETIESIDAIPEI